MTKKLKTLSPIEQEIFSGIQSGNGPQNALAPLIRPDVWVGCVFGKHHFCII